MSDVQDVGDLLSGINQAWLQGRPQDIGAFLHERMVMVFPGFAGRAMGKKQVLAGFEDFCNSARVLRFEESDRQIDVAGNAAVASFSFKVTYERAGATYLGGGRDLWAFSREEGGFLAVWRTMFDVSEEPVQND